jgi:hypothetical protein
MTQIVVEKLNPTDKELRKDYKKSLEDLSTKELQIKGGIIQPDNPSGLDPTIFNPDLIWIVY